MKGKRMKAAFQMLAQWIAENFVKPTVRLLMVLTAIVALGSVWNSTHAQMQQSGGSGSNASVGARAAAQPGSVTLVGGSFNSTLPTVTSGNTESLQMDSSGRLLVGSIASALPAGGNNIGNVTLAGAVPAGTNAIGTVRANPLTSCGNTIYDSGITTVPTAEAAATSTATCVEAIYINNLTSSSQTFSIKDNQGTPVVDVNSFNLPANSNMLLTFGGIKFASGVRWVATNASAVNAQILGYQ